MSVPNISTSSRWQSRRAYVSPGPTRDWSARVPALQGWGVEMLLDELVIPSHTPRVKFAISVPDEVFQAVEAQVQKMGISRSQFFADAARQYVEKFTLADRVAEINAVLDEAGYYGPDEEELAGFAAAFVRAMSDGGWEWEDDVDS
jgi:hypothetical protein